MKYATRLAAVAVFGLSSFARADRDIEGATGSVEVFNYCKEPVYLRSVGDQDPGETTLQPNGQWSERYKVKDHGGGPSIKIRTEGTDILQFEYKASGTEVWYDLSYVNCWNQETHSGERCPFSNNALVVESPGIHIPCKTGESCPYIYHCPHDDHPGTGISTIAGHPVLVMQEPTENLRLHLCPCEDGGDSSACELAHAPGPRFDENRIIGMERYNVCPDGTGYDLPTSESDSSDSDGSWEYREDPREQQWEQWEHWEQSEESEPIFHEY
ncbi:hypothetical protein SLS55_001115 [Diplodia seriata]|uniref:Uncharacterized protein n=1 Tax=Diplodia seriata TaxID=420778 RepID=A0ABR3CW78_9PEZI